MLFFCVRKRENKTRIYAGKVKQRTKKSVICMWQKVWWKRYGSHMTLLGVYLFGIVSNFVNILPVQRASLMALQ